MRCPFPSLPPLPFLASSARRVARFYVTRIGGSEQVAGAFPFESGSASLPLQRNRLRPVIFLHRHITAVSQERRGPSAAEVRAGLLSFRGIFLPTVAPHLSPLRFGFVCRTPGKYNRVQSSGRPTRNFSATILHEKCPMKVKRHGIRPHRRLSVLGEEKGKQRARAKPARPSGQPA